VYKARRCAKRRHVIERDWKDPVLALVDQLRGLRASQQPGKPKPPGNPPNRPEPDETSPIEEPPSPIPTPTEDDSPPMQA
jgi:hypothetical protein